MTKFFKLTAVATFISAIFLVSGCGDTEALIKNGPAGPNTGDLIDPLPEGLIADTENSRHTPSSLNPNIN